MKEEIKSDLSELRSKGYISFCRKFNSETDLDKEYQLQEDNLPLYFTGSLKSKIVSIDLNPQYNHENLLKYSKLSDRITDYSSYKNFCENFASYKYSKSNYTGIQNFDINWINFLNGFGIEDQSYNSNKTTERIIESRNSKLQLEFVPYPSKEFNFKNFDQQYLAKRLDEILNVINTREREIIFVTGAQSTVSKLFQEEIEFFKLNLGNANKPYVGFKKISGQNFCFLSSYKSGPTVGSYLDYGQKSKKAFDSLDW